MVAIQLNCLRRSKCKMVNILVFKKNKLTECNKFYITIFHQKWYHCITHVERFWGKKWFKAIYCIIFILSVIKTVWRELSNCGLYGTESYECQLKDKPLNWVFVQFLAFHFYIRNSNEKYCSVFIWYECHLHGICS